MIQSLELFQTFKPFQTFQSFKPQVSGFAAWLRIEWRRKAGSQRNVWNVVSDWNDWNGLNNWNSYCVCYGGSMTPSKQSLSWLAVKGLISLALFFVLVCAPKPDAGRRRSGGSGELRGA